MYHPDLTNYELIIAKISNKAIKEGRFICWSGLQKYCIQFGFRFCIIQDRELIKTNSGHILTTAQIEKISSYRKKLGEGLAGNTISKI